MMILNLISFGLACFSLGFSIGSKFTNKYIDEKEQDDKKEQDNE